MKYYVVLFASTIVFSSVAMNVNDQEWQMSSKKVVRYCQVNCIQGYPIALIGARECSQSNVPQRRSHKKSKNECGAPLKSFEIADSEKNSSYFSHGFSRKLFHFVKKCSKNNKVD